MLQAPDVPDKRRQLNRLWAFCSWQCSIPLDNHWLNSRMVEQRKRFASLSKPDGLGLKGAIGMVITELDG